MLAENDIFLFHDAAQQLFVYERGGQFGKLTPELIDREMALSHTASALRIHCPTQAGLEHFSKLYGDSYRVLDLRDCRLIQDFSPLEHLKSLESIRIEACQGADALWNFSRNSYLKILSIHSARKIVFNPALLQTSDTLEEIRFWGADSGSKYVLESLSCFRGMKGLRRIDLNHIALQNHDLNVLASLPGLEQFHFDAGMLTTEEIAWICAKYPNLFGDCLRAYTANDPSCVSDVRVCGARKPGLNLPRDQERLDAYVAQFHTLVEKYRHES